MNFRLLAVVLFIILSISLGSCGGGKSASTTLQKTESEKVIQPIPLTFKYRFHLGTYGSETKPHDDIWIDTSGQMTFDTQQRLKNGNWKTPRGMAYLEPRDEDSLLFFISQDILFSIEQSDISPHCPNGEQFSIRIYRTDLKKELSVVTNECASEFNLLTGTQRKIFPPFIAYINRIRERYRPLFTD